MGHELLQPARPLAGEVHGVSSRIGLLISLIAVVAAAVSGPGYRWELWSFRLGFSILRWAAWGGLAGAGVALTGGVLARVKGDREDMLLALVGAGVGLAIFGWPWYLAQAAKSVPAIHDISTDTETPPVFAAILPLRGRRQPQRVRRCRGRQTAAAGISRHQDAAPPRRF